MYLLNLTLAQFLAVFGSVAAVAVALYLLDRSRRRQVVSTLRFWFAADQPAVAARRRRIQQPWSLILQLLGMALLLLAVAQLRIGARGDGGRDHVIVLDTSAWMAARSGNRTLMDLARDRALRYLHALPARDRVMLIRADALATPATAFETDRGKVEAAIRASNPGFTALNLDQALSFARHAQFQDGRIAGEIAYVGAGRIAEPDPGAPPPPRNLRVLLVPDVIPNWGLRKISARRSSTDPDLWDIYIAAHNSGVAPRQVTLSLDFAAPGRPAVPIGSRPLDLPAGGDGEANFQYRAAGAGTLGVSISPPDAFPADNRAALDLPAQHVLRVTVYSDEPDLLRPVLESTRLVAAVYRKPAEYRSGDTGLVILDRFVPPARPTADSIWIDPPADGSPIPVRDTVEHAPLVRWDSATPIATGLRAKDLRLEHASVFATAPGDLAIGEVAGGPVIVARPGSPNMVVFGFNPALAGMRYELTTPLLFANLLRWFAPDVFRLSEIAGGSVGMMKLELGGADDRFSSSADRQDTETDGLTHVSVTGAGGTPVPFSVHGRELHFFSGSPGPVRVLAGDRLYDFSLTLPQPWDVRWQPPAGARRGLPRFAAVPRPSGELWPWLALAGALVLVAEWFLWGRRSFVVVCPVRRPLRSDGLRHRPLAVRR
jgi:hypothetical protein